MEDESWSNVPYEDVIGPIFKKSVEEVASALKSTLDTNCSNSKELYDEAVQDMKNILKQLNQKDNI